MTHSERLATITEQDRHLNDWAFRVVSRHRGGSPTLAVDDSTSWRLDRLGRSLKHLITVVEELQPTGVAFVSIEEGIDCTTTAGRLQLQVLAAWAEFERERIRERVVAGFSAPDGKGTKLGRPPSRSPR